MSRVFALELIFSRLIFRLSRVFAVLDDIFDECFEIWVFGSSKIRECIEILLDRTIFLANVSNFLLLGSLENSNVSNFGLD